MPDNKALDRSGLRIEHAALKRASEALTAEHQRLRRHGCTSAERSAHRARLRNTIIKLEQHYQRLRWQARRQHQERQRRLATDRDERIRPG